MIHNFQGQHRVQRGSGGKMEYFISLSLMKANGIFVQRPRLIILTSHRHSETAIIFEIIHVRKASRYVRVRKNIKARGE